MHQIKILGVRKDVEEMKHKLKDIRETQTTLKKFKGLIRLKSGGHPVEVYCDATSPNSAKKIIEAQFDVKSWFKQMSIK
jgi:hypothetical protein